jgi:hypothetical protein
MGSASVWADLGKRRTQPPRFIELVRLRQRTLFTSSRSYTLRRTDSAIAFEGPSRKHSASRSFRTLAQCVADKVLSRETGAIVGEVYTSSEGRDR